MNPDLRPIDGEPHAYELFVDGVAIARMVINWTPPSERFDGLSSSNYHLCLSGYDVRVPDPGLNPQRIIVTSCGVVKIPHFLIGADTARIPRATEIDKEYARSKGWIR